MTTNSQKGGPKTRLLCHPPRTLLEAARAEAFGPGRDGLLRFAKAMGRCPAYVRQIELYGRAPQVYADVARRKLGCHPHLLMWPNWQPSDLCRPTKTACEQTESACEQTESEQRQTSQPSQERQTSQQDRRKAVGRGGARVETNPRRLLAQAAHDKSPGSRHDQMSGTTR